VSPSLDDRLHRSLAHVLDRAKPEANASFTFSVFFDRKVITAVVHIRRQHLDAHVVAFRSIDGTLFVIVLPGGEQRGHVFHRIAIFQVSGFDRNHAIVRGVAFIEAVMRKGFPMGKDIFGCLFLNAVLDRAFDELVVMFFDFLDLLFRDRRAQVIRLARGVACQLHGGDHDLLLVDRVPVGLAQDRLQLFVLVGHWFFAVHVGNIFRDAFHWTRAEERYHGDDMMDGLGLHLHQVAGHTAAFQLEETDRMPFADELIDFRIVNRDVAEGELDAVTLADVLAGFGHDRERHQPQEVHFEQAEIVDSIHFVLRHGFDRQFITAARRSV